MRTLHDQVDVALVVCEGSAASFDNAISPYWQVTQHIQLATAFNVSKLVVAVAVGPFLSRNAMKHVFTVAKRECSSLLNDEGISADNTPFVPICSNNGDLVVFHSPKMTWFRGWSVEQSDGVHMGMTVVDALRSWMPLHNPNLDMQVTRDYPLELKDFEEILKLHVLDVIQEEHGVDLKGNEEAVQRISVAAKGASQQLATHLEATIILPKLVKMSSGWKDFNLCVTHSKFKAIYTNRLKAMTANKNEESTSGEFTNSFIIKSSSEGNRVKATFNVCGVDSSMKASKHYEVTLCG
jgi:sulfate adenylyltransferase subunit 1 (EFTu-like GTPase family)